MYEFEKTARDHTNGQGCPKCSKKEKYLNYKLSKEDLIYSFNKKHDNKYVYSFVDYVNLKTNIKIICPIHGVFEQHFGSDAKSYLHKFSLGIKDIILEKEHRKANFISDFSSKIYKDNIPAVFLIKIDNITGKKRLDFTA